VRGKYNYPSPQGRTFSDTDATVFSVPHGRTVNIILRYFPSLRYLTFTIGRKQHTHYKTPKNGVNLRNNFSVGPRHCGWALQWL